MKTFKDTEYGDLIGKTYDGAIVVNKDVESLEGSPKIVKGKFSCSICKNLKDLKGAPETIEGDFSCRLSPNLKTLEGSPKIVKGDFNCRRSPNLKTLEGSPKVVQGSFSCSVCENLESLKGAPEKCKTFNCIGCTNLKNLDPLLKCEIEEVKADKELLEDYLRKKAAVEKHGYDKAMKVIEMMEEII